MATRALSPPTGINAGHLVAGFSCGNFTMDAWLKQHAFANEARASRTYVVADKANSVVAYYSLAMGALERRTLPRKLRHDLPPDVPVSVLGRLAVDNEHSGQGLGGALLAEGIRRTLQLANEIGVRGLVVHAVDEHAAGFYQRYAFVSLPGNPMSLILPVETMTAALHALVTL